MYVGEGEAQSVLGKAWNIGERAEFSRSSEGRHCTYSSISVEVLVQLLETASVKRVGFHGALDGLG